MGFFACTVGDAAPVLSQSSESSPGGVASLRSAPRLLAGRSLTESLS